MKKSKTTLAVEWIIENQSRTDTEAAKRFGLASPSSISHYRKKHGINRNYDCITHHCACDCREEKFQNLIGAMRDWTSVVDGLTKYALGYEKVMILGAIERVNEVCDTLEIE